MSEQQNHHCLVTFAGFDWCIVGCRRHEIIAARPNLIGTSFGWVVSGAIISSIDTRNVDWDAYAETARAWDERREAVRAESAS